MFSPFFPLFFFPHVNHACKMLSLKEKKKKHQTLNSQTAQLNKDLIF